jgi:hypothetical protein
LVNGTTVRQGDRAAFVYFAQHPSELSATDGVHTTDTGAASLTGLWKAAIFAATPTVAPSSSATSTGATLAANLAGGTAPFTYAWSGTGLTFSNSAVANPTATVAAAGTYTASLTVTDANSATASGSTSFTVTQTATTVTVSPSSASLANLATQTFSAAVADQFGNAIASPTVAWSYTPGGAVNSSTGVVTQGGGTVTATSGGHTGTATVLPGGTGTYPAASKVLTTAGTFGPNGTDFTPTYNATPPGVISDLAVSVNGSLLAAFTWSASATATGYYVFSRRDTGGFSPYATPGGVPITDTTFSAPLAAGHDYVFQVQAINASGVISYSFPIAYSTKPADVIPAAGTIYTGTPFGLGGTQTGTLTLPSASNVLSAAPAFGVGGNSSAGTWVSATTANVRSGTFFGAGGTSLTGTLDLPATTNVRTGIVYDNGSKTGTLSAGGTYTAAVNVLAGVDRGDGTFGTLTLASASNVLNTAPTFGVGGTSVLGTYVAPSGSNVRNGLAYGASGTGQAGTLAVPLRQYVYTGIAVDNTTGTLTLPNAANVLQGVTFGIGGTSATGTATVGGGGTGSGTYPVNHNTAADGSQSLDALRVTNADGDGIPGVVITAFLSSEYSQGVYTDRGQTTTGAYGRWNAPLMLNPATAYTLVFTKAGSFNPATATVALP